MNTSILDQKLLTLTMEILKEKYKDFVPYGENLQTNDGVEMLCFHKLGKENIKSPFRNDIYIVHQYGGDELLHMDMTIDIPNSEIEILNIYNYQEHSRGFGSIAMKYVFECADQLNINKIYGKRDYEVEEQPKTYFYKGKLCNTTQKERQERYYEKFNFKVTDNKFIWERGENPHPLENIE